MKSLKYLILILIFVAATGCSPFEKKNKLEFSGTVEMTEHALGAPAPGRIKDMLVEEGAVVKKGQTLATFDRYEQNKKDYERLQAMLAQGGETQQSLEHAQLNLNDQAVTSPVDGVVLIKVHEAGEVVAGGSAVVVVGDTSSLWVKIFIPEGDINKIHMNDKAELRFDGVSQSLEGHVSYISPKAEFTPRNVQTQEERVTQTFAVKVTIDNSPANIRTGVACDVTLSLKDNND